MSTNLLPICPEDCTSNLPVFNFTECAPVLLEGQITDFFIGKSGQPFVDWHDADEWETRVSNTSTADNAIRHLAVIGDMPAASSTEKTISHRRVVKTGKTRTINYVIDDVSDENYDAARQLECGGSRPVWFLSGGKLFGGNEGILVNLDMNPVIPNSLDEFQTLVGTAAWKTKFSPERIDVPFDLADLSTAQ